MLARPEKGVENGVTTIVGASASATDEEGDNDTKKEEEVSVKMRGRSGGAGRASNHFRPPSQRKAIPWPPRWLVMALLADMDDNGR